MTRDEVTRSRVPQDVPADDTQAGTLAATEQPMPPLADRVVVAVWVQEHALAGQYQAVAERRKHVVDGLGLARLRLAGGEVHLQAVDR
jgi:hypothetical protein